jgi:hypothetical protein
MSMYLSFVPMIERQAAENASALPDAPQRTEATRPQHARLAAAALLRRVAAAELAVASRLERRETHRPIVA